MRGDQILSKEIEIYFRTLLETLYENCEDIPDTWLETAFKYPAQLEGCVQYSVSKNEIVIEKTGKDVLECFEYLEYRISPIIFSNNSEQASCYIQAPKCAIMIRFSFPPNSELISGIAVAFLKKLFVPLQNFTADVECLVHNIYNPLDFCCFQKEKYDPMDFYFICPQTGKKNQLIMHYDKNALLIDSISETLAWRFNLDIHMLSMLSSAKYEGTQALGSLIKGTRGYTRKKRQQAEIIFDSKIDFELYNIRYIRKILEISNQELSLLVTYNNQLVGLAKNSTPYECKINIRGALKWDIIWNNQIIRFRDGVFKIPSSRNTAINFPANSVFSECDLNRIQCVIQQAAQQNHGTLIILSTRENIVSEVDRLCVYHRGIKISPIDLVEHQDVIRNLTAIDGAIMMDTECICYGIGMILDGEVVAKGTPSRGARYNSAINYVKNKEINGQKYNAIIISEDKTIDLT